MSMSVCLCLCQRYVDFEPWSRLRLLENKKGSLGLEVRGHNYSCKVIYTEGLHMQNVNKRKVLCYS